MLWLQPTKSLLFKGVLLLTVFLILNSCNKDPEDIGNTLTPSQDLLYSNATDTVAILAHSMLSDSILTGYASPVLAGSYMDPVFGRTTAGFVTEYELASLSPAFGPGATPDSLILSLAYYGYYGDTNTLQTMRVFEISDALVADTSYYSYSPVPHYDTPLAVKTFKPRPTDSVYVDAVKKAAFLRLNLSEINPSLGVKILNASADDLNSNDNFAKYFKGLYVTADAQTYGGAILYFNVLSSLSRLTLYYHNDTTDSLKVVMLAQASTTTRFTVFDHHNYDYASQELRQQVIYGDTTLGQQTTYVQTMGGISTKIRLPNIAKWKNAAKTAINEAVLMMPCDAANGFPQVADLNLGRLASDGTYLSWGNDASGNPIYFLTGTYISASNEYGFRITKHVQDLVLGRIQDNGLVLTAAGPANKANRVVIHGPQRADKPMRLRVTYSYVP